jgi:hypothetical protein
MMKAPSHRLNKDQSWTDVVDTANEIKMMTPDIPTIFSILANAIPDEIASTRQH